MWRFAGISQSARAGCATGEGARGCATTAPTGGRKDLLEAPRCTKDEGRPLGIGLQDQAPNRLKQLRSKAVVVSVDHQPASVQCFGLRLVAHRASQL